MDLGAIKQNGMLIQYIKNPSEKVQLAAVKQNGWVIGFIENPSKSIQLVSTQFKLEQC